MGLLVTEFSLESTNMWIIEETLPNDSLSAEAILHVRRHLRAAVRAKTKVASIALAVLFGRPWEDGELEQWQDAAGSANPMQAGAAVVTNSSEATPLVHLGHDEAHVENCRRWLELRIRSEPEFEAIVADDLATLLAMSTAMELALAQDYEGGYLPILIRGETGTGKELLAKAIHAYWKRKGTADDNSDFHVVQVAGISSHLIYGELFGAAKGAYTGATSDRQGHMEAANGGTLLIDEVGDLPPEAQVALLRFLQTGKIKRLGDTKERCVKVRILAATWRDLETAISEGKFRVDLLHRIRGGGAIMLPALRERVPFDGVVDQILDVRRKESRFTRSARDALRLYEWPGNLRELVTALDATVAVAQGGEVIRLEDLPRYLQRTYLARPLIDRAPGIICDMADDSMLDEELIKTRVAKLSQVMLLEVEVEATELTALLKLLRKLVDVSGENAQAMAMVEHALTRASDEARFRAIADAWQEVLGKPDLPGSVSQVLYREHGEMVGETKLAGIEARAAMANRAVTENPWLQMLQDLRASPLLSQAPAAAIVDVMLFVQTSLAQMAPEFTRNAVQAYRENRFRGVIRFCIDELEEFEQARYIDAEQSDDEDDEDDEDDVHVQPKDRRLEFWQQLAEQPKLKDACAQSGYSAKTIRENLAKNGLSPSWKKKK